MKSKKIKIFLSAIFLFLLLLPLLLSLIGSVKVKGLDGAVKLAKKPEIEIQDWFSGDFQKQYETYINDNVGFRPWLVRLRNQIAFSFFNEARAVGVTRGKNNYLYEGNYIRAYNGDDFLGLDSINGNVKRIKYLQDTLHNMGKSLITCIAPGKGSFYPEFFPEKYNKSKTDSTNYKQYSKAFQFEGVNTIDFNKWFLDMKDTCSCLLYPKYGIHWSHYGMLIASDSLIKYIEADRDINMPNLEILNITHSRKLKGTDYDIAKGMNLMFQMPSEPMCYPEYHWASDSTTVKPKVLVVSDSFYWSMFNIGISTKSFRLGGFWYYNNKIYPDSFDKPTSVTQKNLRNVIDEIDVIILMTTEANMPKFSWGFVEDAIKSLKNHTSDIPIEKEEVKISQARINSMIKYMKSDKNWMKKIKMKAKERNISVDSMLVVDAKWSLRNQK